MLLDSFKLMRLRLLGVCLLAGVASAVAALVLNTSLGPTAAPLVEEVLKSLWIVWLIHRSRIGFSVDAAIAGFAVGTGFALAENTWYLLALTDAPPQLWILRGLGTAVLHGTLTAAFALLARAVARTRTVPLAWGAALVPVVILHAAWNAVPLDPRTQVVALLLVAPVALVLVFRESERRTRIWLGSGFDRDQEVLAHVLGGTLPDTPVGEYLQGLRGHVAPVVLVDMVNLLRLRIEQSLRVKGRILLRAHGFTEPPDADEADRLAELRYLEKAVGPAGVLALNTLHPHDPARSPRHPENRRERLPDR
ncbi:MAG: PrsW family glutamic-type intramembrane protease [Rhodothermales bacterium]